MGVSDVYTRRVLHLAYILECEFDPYNPDIETLKRKEKIWYSNIEDSHETLFSDIYREILNLCDKIAGNIYRFIRRNDIEDREILDLCNQIDNSKMMELVAENKDKFVKFLRLIQHAQKHEDGIELEDGVNAIRTIRSICWRRHHISKDS